MEPTTKSETEKFLIGQPTLVLDKTWHQALASDTLELSPFLLPFLGLARLPTRGQTLLLYYAIREVKEWDRKSKVDIAEMV